MVKKTAPVGFRMRQRSFMIEHRPGIAHVEKAAAHSHRKKCSASSRLHADALADDDPQVDRDVGLRDVLVDLAVGEAGQRGVLGHDQRLGLRDAVVLDLGQGGLGKRERVVVNATDPCNLVGTIIPGATVPSIRARQIVYVDGIPEAFVDAPADTSTQRTA
jgi:hypothetical protein